MYCILNATAANGKPSILWQSLMNKYRDRDFVKSIYCAVMKMPMDKFDVFDVNGEPTLEDVESKISKSNFNVEAQAAMWEDLFNSEENETVTDFVRKAVSFNKEHNDMIAIPVQVGKENRMQVRKVDLQSSQEKKQLEDSLNEYNQVENILRKFGLDVHILDAGLFEQEDGLMDPKNLGKMAKGMLGVVNIANNMTGFNSLTEEFSHTLVEVLRAEGNSIVDRAERVLMDNPDLVKEILGEEYDRVKEYYEQRGEPELLYTEALGRLVADIVNGKTQGNTNVTGRAAGAVRKLIDRVFKTDDQSLIDEVNKLVEELSAATYEFMERESLKQETLERFKEIGRRLAHAQRMTAESNERLKRASDLAEKNIVKFLNVYAKDTKRFKYMQEMFDHMQKLNFLDGAIGFVDDVQKHLKDNLTALEETALTDELSLYDIRGYGHQLLTLKNTIDCFREPVEEIKMVLRELQETGLMTPDERVVVEAALNDIVPACIDIMNTIDKEFNELNKKVITMFANRYFNDGKGDLEITFGKYKGELIKLENVLEYSEGDINILTRMLCSAYRTDDMYIQLCDQIITDQDDEIRAMSLVIDHKIQVIDKEFRNSGEKYDTSFILERDDKGEKTGNLASKWLIWKWERDRREHEKHLIEKYTSEDGTVDYDAVKKYMDLWDNENTFMLEVPYVRKWRDEKGKLQSHNDVHEYMMPKGDKYKNKDFQKGWSQAQKTYYDKYLAIKQRELDPILPRERVHPYRAVQMMVSSTGEAILNSDNGFVGGIKTAFATATNNAFRVTGNDDGQYFEGSDGKVKNYFNVLKGKLTKEESTETRTRLTFDKRVYKEVPTYFVAKLSKKDMPRLSTDATSALREYCLMACHYSGMHKIADMMELMRELGRHRKIKRTNSSGQRVVEKIKRRMGDTTFEAKIDSEIPTETSNEFARLEELIDMRVYSRNREQGKRLIGNVTSGKVIDSLIKLTSFSLLGYSAFSGINNVTVAKQQMLIESYGGRFFTVKDWLRADKEFIKHAGEAFAELTVPYTTSFLGLIGEMFNVGLNWKEHIKESKAYKNNFEQFISNFGPSCLLESGEYSIQMSTALSMLIATKLYKGPIQRDDEGNIKNESVSLLDAIEKVDIKDANGKIVDAKLGIKEEYKNYVKEDGTEFKFYTRSEDVKRLSQMIGAVNHDMHGIYNTEDQSVITRYGIGRMGMLFRKHMVPQIQNRWKGLGKQKPIYNFRTRSFEEGYMVTMYRFMRDAILSKNMIKYLHLEDNDGVDSWTGRIAVAYNALTKYEKVNMRKAFIEIAEIITLLALTSFVMADWEDEDDWTKRQVLYFTKRMQLESTMPYSGKSFLDVLISPSAVISQIQRYTRAIGSIGQGERILQSGPYAGHSVTYANFMRCLPVYPQVYDFIHIDEDNRRFEVFKESPNIIVNILTDDSQ